MLKYRGVYRGDMSIGGGGGLTRSVWAPLTLLTTPGFGLVV